MDSLKSIETAEIIKESPSCLIVNATPFSWSHPAFPLEPFSRKEVTIHNTDRLYPQNLEYKSHNNDKYTHIHTIPNFSLLYRNDIESYYLHIDSNNKYNNNNNNILLSYDSRHNLIITYTPLDYDIISRNSTTSPLLSSDVLSSDAVTNPHTILFSGPERLQIDDIHTYNPLDYPYAHWMSDYYHLLKHKRLDQICLLGSHDAGMSILTPGGTDKVSSRVTITQSYNIKQQLLLGTRYFDLRPCWTGNSQNPWSLGHYSNLWYGGWQGQQGEYLDDVIDAIAEYIQTHNDLVIFKLSHALDITIPNEQYKEITALQWEEVINKFINHPIISLHLVRKNNDFIKPVNILTLDELMHTNNINNTNNTSSQSYGTLLLTIESDTISVFNRQHEGLYHFISPHEYNNDKTCFILYDIYSDKYDVNLMMSDQCDKMIKNTPISSDVDTITTIIDNNIINTADNIPYKPSYFLLSWTLTPNWELTMEHHDTMPTVLYLARTATKHLIPQLSQWYTSSHLPPQLKDNIKQKMLESGKPLITTNYDDWIYTPLEYHNTLYKQYPNIIYIDDISSHDQCAITIALNLFRFKNEL